MIPILFFFMINSENKASLKNDKFAPGASLVYNLLHMHCKVWSSRRTWEGAAEFRLPEFSCQMRGGVYEPQ